MRPMTGPVCVGALALAATLTFGAGPSRAANVAHTGFSDPSSVTTTLTAAGHVVTELSVAAIEGGALSTGAYDVFVIAREGLACGGPSPAYETAIGAYVAAGGNVVAEWAAGGLFFSGYDPGVYCAGGPQLGTFAGIVHAGDPNGSSIDLVLPSHPTVSGIADPYSDGGGSEFMFWIESPDPALDTVGQVVGNGGEFPIGQNLPVILTGCAGSSRIVLGLHDWNDTVGSSIIAQTFLTNSVAYAAAGCSTPLDHFLFYKRKRTDGAPKFYGFEPITLADQFGTRAFKVVKPFRLGAPADKNGEGINDPDTHLEEYKLAKAAPAFAAIPNTRIVNQCNDINVKVIKPFSLLVPTGKDLLGPVAVPDSRLDHFLCYKAKAETPFPRGIQVDVADQFQTRRYDLKGITKLCNPVAKSGSPIFSSGPNKGDPKAIAPAAINNPIDHLVCYRAVRAKKLIAQTGCGPTTPGDPGTPIPPQAPHVPVVGLYTNNQFGPERHDTIKEAELCIPSYENPVCGDAVVNQASEQCDGTADEACGGLPCLGDCTCTPPSCGDNIVNQPGEQCDGTDDASCAGGCLAGCVCPVCGNGTIEPPLEQCEPTDDSACPGLCTACACEGALRLVDGPDSTQGRLEVLHAGQWGTVCDDGFGSVDATVACQQLGFSSGAALCCASFGPGVNPIWMDDLACTGSESRLVDCPFLGFGSHNCSHSEDVGIVCTP